MIEELNKYLDTLELERVKEVLPDYIHKNSKNMPPLTDSLNYLLGEEIKYKDNRAAEGIIKASNFPFRKTLEDYNFSFQPSVNENQIRELSNLGFVENHENIILLGGSNTASLVLKYKTDEFSIINKVLKDYDDIGRGKSSESVGSYSVSYNSDIKKVIEDKNTEIRDLISTDLYGVVYNGEHLIYCGV